MPISSSSNRLTASTVATSEAVTDERSGAKSVPVFRVESPAAATAPTPVDGTGSITAADSRKEKPATATKDKVKLPLITRIQNSIFGRRSRSHDTATAVDKRSETLNRPTPPPRRHRRSKHHQKVAHSPEFALRKIRFFTFLPTPSPMTVCFTYPGVDLTHRDVMKAIQSLQTVDADDIESVQFVDMNVILGTAGVPNRWLITVKDYDTRYLLLCDGLKFNDEYVIMRKYDDVNMEDYKEYMRRKDTLASDEHTAVQRLLSM